MAENRKRDEIRLSDHFTYGRLIRFTLPSIAMMIFTSIYGVVDGIFVSNFVGETPFAALNLIMPYIMIFSAVGFMLGTGGSALVAFTLGTGDRKRANEIFSLLVYVLIALGALFTVVGIVLAEPASRHCRKAGARFACHCGGRCHQYVSGLALRRNAGIWTGRRGVAAYGIIMYTNFIFIGIFLGYAMGAAPVVGYNYGAGNIKELQNVFKKSVKLMLSSSGIIAVISVLSARLLALIFASQNEALLNMTVTAIRIYSISYLFTGMNIFGSSFFTALNNGKISALISFMRTLVFQILFVLTLPELFGINGIWLSIVAAELCALILTVVCLIANRAKYQYA